MRCNTLIVTGALETVKVVSAVDSNQPRSNLLWVTLRSPFWVVLAIIAAYADSACMPNQNGSPATAAINATATTRIIFPTIASLLKS